MSKDASNGTKGKSNSFSVAITKLFHKSHKDHKGGSTKEKKTDTTDTTIDVHRSRSGSTSKNTPPPVPHETIPTPTTKEDTPAHNGRGSHNDTESNTTGESSHVATDTGIKQDHHQGHTTTTTTPNAIATPDKPTQTTEENRTRPPTPPADITQKQHKSPSTVQPTTSTSPETPTHHVVDRVKDADLVDSARSSGELLDVHQPTKMKKNRSGFVPLPFEEKPKIDTPNSRQRSSGPPEILPEEITYEESDLVGHGSFGSVYKGRCRGQEVAVKVPKKQKLTMAELTSFRNEVKIMSVIYHPHVVLFLGACTQLGKMQIITERCMTDLEKLLASDRDKKHYSLFHRMQMAKDAALGVNWLHSKCNIVHLDLKSANLLLDHNMRVKVTDFGFSQIKDTLSADKAKKGTPLWMAPEVMMGQKYDEKADVYSFGIILWEILTREIPYAHHNDYQTFFRAVCLDKERPPIPPNTPPSLEHLITSCWDFNPQKRPSFEEIIYRLSEVLVDCCVDSEEAGDLWKKNFLVPKQELTEQVPWPEFEAVVRKSVEKHNVNLDNLRLFLVCPARDPILKGKEVVTMERFDKVIKWFGMFFDPEEGPAIIDEVNELVKKGWFHGDLPKEIAMDRLSKKDEGTFLIRLSSTDPKISPFTLSMTNNQHRRIRRTTVEEDGVKGYNIIGKPTVYNSLVELAEKCMDYNLRFACPKETPGNYNPYDPYREVVLSHSN